MHTLTREKADKYVNVPQVSGKVSAKPAAPGDNRSGRQNGTIADAGIARHVARHDSCVRYKFHPDPKWKSKNTLTNRKCQSKLGIEHRHFALGRVEMIL